MLRSFRLGNHRSFHDEQELLLMPMNAKERQALPVAAIYGANASGKSNLLDGLRFMATAVRDSFATWQPDGGIPRRFHRLDHDARDQPSVFVAELVEAGVRYTYGFEIDDKRVRNEWLYSYPERRKRLLFERSGDAVRFGSTMSSAKLEVLEDLLRPNALFLSLAAQSNLEPLLPVYRWFTSRLVFRLDSGSAVGSSAIIGFLLENDALNDQLTGLLQAADFGISKILMATPPGKPLNSDYLAKIVNHFQERELRIVLEHGSGAVFELEDESAGTRSWLGLLPIVLTVLRDGGTLVIDEIDASLHSLLSARLVGLFNDSESNPSGGQLIFTTHDATLLHPPLGDEVLHRDEVWFVEKSASGKSVLYPLTDFKPRVEDNLERRYLAGRYGAVPDLREERFVNAVRSHGADVEA